MYVDLLTLYFIIIGTLLASAGLTFWEHRTHPSRSGSLRILAAGFATLAVGCTVALFRAKLPGAFGSAVANLIVLSGYLLIMNGAASLSGRRYRAASYGLLIVMALIWLAAGDEGQDVVWKYISAFPIALVSGMTAWELLRCQSLRSLTPLRIATAVASIHALVYTARAFILPWWVAEHGPGVHLAASTLTMYEGVLYSIVLPMTLLKLIREETHGQLLRESQTDYLTRLGNRRWFFEQGARIIEGGAGRGPVAVLAFDLDQFKAINDRHGHQAGDQVLKFFADAARCVLGDGVLLARIGGEEFAALLSGPDARRATVLGAAVAQHFAVTVSGRDDSLGIPATVSVGLAQFEDKVPPLADALAAADRALYRAKALGGNRVELASAAASPVSC
ncbi:GGDEF domain-containing protein [Achromobacter pestifer]|uniref:diguanylate cyclase n=1 Tax=Achromobacter pestifer TaxID=1353889 RepID=A0A7D4E038_9BURK|nr:GGDEF domain-containing protein [Achromobacter pestifer]QKH38275.1 GGDEF domain-containing protein [Achromobacter pestifer]